MFRFLTRAIDRLALNRSRKTSALEAAYRDAFKAYTNACERGDTRDQGAAWTRLRNAMSDRLAAGIRPAPSAWRGSR